MEAKHHIGGAWISSDETFPSVNPEDESLVGNAAKGGREHVSGAVEAARAAFASWSGVSVGERAEFVKRAADLLALEYGDMGKPTKLKQLIKTEMGKRLPEADIEVIESSDMLRFFADQGPHCLADRPLALDRELWPSKRSTVAFEPLGVVGVIKPWNYPLELPLWSIGAAITAGNTVVFKPSELTPFVASYIVDVFQRAGLPVGVLNMVLGDGTTGAHLVEHPGVDMISFTGSAPVGHEIALKCVKRSCRIALELGGKDAMIVLPDADLDLAVNGALWGAFCNCGQVCVGVRRLLLASEIKDVFLDRFMNGAKQLRLSEDIAPLASEQQREKVEIHVRNAIDHGACVLCGGRRPAGDRFARGYYYEPTILIDTSPEMLVEKDDTFGPVVTVKTFSSDKEAVAIANAPLYDLGASIWTEDSRHGLELARQLRSGMVWLNDVNVAFPQAPWGGRRWSGHGLELSEFAFYEYTSLKHVSCETGKEKRRAWWFPYS